MLQQMTLLLAAFLLMMSTLASGGSISSSGIFAPLVYTCETLPVDASLRGLKLRIGPGETLEAQIITLVENRGVAVAPGAFPAIVEMRHPAISGPVSSVRYVDAPAGILVDILSDSRRDFWTSTHLGHIALWAPTADLGFSAFLSCSAKPW
jgi:hypothetical protein